MREYILIAAPVVEVVMIICWSITYCILGPPRFPLWQRLIFGAAIGALWPISIPLLWWAAREP